MMKQMRGASIAGMTVLLLLACSTEVQVGSGSGGSTSAAGGAGQGGAGQGGGSCVLEQNAATIVVSQGNAQPFDCALDGSPTSESLQGIIMTATPDGYVLDTCPPNADCDETALWTIEVGYDGLTPVIPAGTLVQFEYFNQYVQYTCKQSVTLRNLPTFEGLMNPAGDGEHLWLFVTHGQDDSGFEVETSQWCEGIDDVMAQYSLQTMHITAAVGNAPALSLNPAESGVLQVPSGINAGSYQVTNVAMWSCCLELSQRSYGIARQAQSNP